jgi:hypothetical protein
LLAVAGVVDQAVAVLAVLAALEQQVDLFLFQEHRIQ